MSMPVTPNGGLRPCYVPLEPVTPKMAPNFSAELRRALNERNQLTTKTKRRVNEALKQIENDQRAESNRTKVDHIIDEIITSERKYVKQLEIIWEFFAKPAMEKQLLEPGDFDVLFGHIDSIHKIHRELLEEFGKRGDSLANLARAFSKIAPFFKTYSFYAVEFKKSLEILQNCHKGHYSKFAKFVEGQETRPEVQSKLSALLIAPIQRIPKYKLLLRPLVKLTPPLDDNYDSLTDSLRKVEEGAEHINKVIREREHMQRLIELQRCLQQSDPNIITPGRCLLKEGVLTYLKNDSRTRQVYLVLTNDIIMFCKVRHGSQMPETKSLKCQGIYPLHKCKVLEILDKGSFRLICQNEEVVLYNSSLEDTRQWIEAIKEAIERLVEDRKTLRKESTIRRPVKRKDVYEYNEIGVSPGKKLRKRRPQYEPLVVGRPSIRFDSPAVSNSGLSQSQELVNYDGREVSKDLFVFGRNEQQGFSFNKWFCGIGSGVKKIFGFNTRT